MHKKSLLVTIISILLPAISFAGNFNGWIYQNPYPTSNTLLAVKFVTPKKGWIAGEKGTILYTEDGGDTWEAQESGTWEDFKSIFFINEKVGWAVGNGGVIVHTEDGGKHWSPQGDVKISLNKVYFQSDNDGWIVGDSGTVLHTVDGGRNWAAKKIDARQSIASVFFLDSKAGWLLAGKKVYKTTDGGNHWESTILPVNDPKEMIDERWWSGDIFFVDAKKGWAVVGLSNIYQTEDGGKTWDNQQINTELYGFGISKIAFQDAMNGCVAGATILCTDNGGQMWEERLGIKEYYGDIDGFESGLWGLSFPDQSTAWAVGYGGLIMKTENGGKSWHVKTKSIGKYAMFDFVNKETGFYFKIEKPSILSTEDGGLTWITQKRFDEKLGGSIAVYAQTFINSTTGWLVGSRVRTGPNGKENMSSLILYTNDGGKTWTPQLDEPGPFEPEKFYSGCRLFNLFFIDDKTAWAVGERGLIFHTEDGGKHWVRQKSGTKFWLHGVFFLNAKKGWVLGNKSNEKSIVLYTEDGGKHWQVQLKKQDLWLSQVVFTDNNTGWISAVAGAGPGDGVGEVVLFHTSNGGKSWSERQFGDISSGVLFFIDKDRGVLAADKERNYITIDGGKTWERRRVLIRKTAWHVSELFGQQPHSK